MEAKLTAWKKTYQIMRQSSDILLIDMTKTNADVR